MGAWGYRSFENDHASDWLADFLEQPGKRALAKTLRNATRQPADDRELPEESAAVAAAEIIACLAGRRGKNLDGDVTDWLDGTTASADKPLVALALKTLDEVQVGGELSQSFDAAGRRRWLVAMKDLRTRLSAALTDKQAGKSRPPRPAKPLAKRIRRGDIVEIKVSRGFAYAQFINEHKHYGKLLRVLPSTHSRRQTDFESLVAKSGGWCAFWLIEDSMRKGEVAVVGRAEISKPYQRLPVFKLADRSLATALVRNWSIWDGKNTSGRPVAGLTEEQKRFPLAESIFTEDVIKRINRRWKPEDECLPGATSTRQPLKFPPQVLALRKAAERARES